MFMRHNTNRPSHPDGRWHCRTGALLATTNFRVCDMNCVGLHQQSSAVTARIGLKYPWSAVFNPLFWPAEPRDAIRCSPPPWPRGRKVRGADAGDAIRLDEPIRAPNDLVHNRDARFEIR